MSLATICSAQDKTGKDDAAVQKDLKLLQGSWVIVGKEFKGKKATKEELEELKGVMVIKDNTVTQYAEASGKLEVVSEATLKLDPSAKPKAVDATYTKGELKGTTDEAIYEIDAETLKVCWAVPLDAKRPREFAGKNDGNEVLLVYKRQKK
jgi:uncharacterized protein (TIGR03067 family)